MEKKRAFPPAKDQKIPASPAVAASCQEATLLTTTSLETPLGSMVVISDTTWLYLLEFCDSKGVERKIKKICLETKARLMPGTTEPIATLKRDLKAYFKGTCTAFEASFYLLGSPFQKRVWKELTQVPYGQTRSYLQQAESLNKPQAVRAVARANGANPLALVIPCHRIINNNGALGGYGGGLARKKWLLDHEKTHV